MNAYTLKYTCDHIEDLLGLPKFNLKFGLTKKGDFQFGKVDEENGGRHYNTVDIVALACYMIIEKHTKTHTEAAMLSHAVKTRVSAKLGLLDLYVGETPSLYNQLRKAVVFNNEVIFVTEGGKLPSSTFLPVFDIEEIAKAIPQKLIARLKADMLD